MTEANRPKRALSAAALARLRDGLADHPRALPFAEAVALHLAWAPAGAEREHERRVVDAVVGILAEAAREPPPIDALTARLLADPGLLASFFQNLDLLFEHRAPAGAPLAESLALALERLAASAEEVR